MGSRNHKKQQGPDASQTPTGRRGGQSPMPTTWTAAASRTARSAEAIGKPQLPQFRRRYGFADRWFHIVCAGCGGKPCCRCRCALCTHFSQTGVIAMKAVVFKGRGRVASRRHSEATAARPARQFMRVTTGRRIYGADVHMVRGRAPDFARSGSGREPSVLLDRGWRWPA